MPAALSGPPGRERPDSTRLTMAWAHPAGGFVLFDRRNQVWTIQLHFPTSIGCMKLFLQQVPVPMEPRSWNGQIVGWI